MVQDILRRAATALERWPLGQSMLRFSLGLLPAAAWEEGLGDELAALQREIEAWAAEARARAAGEEIVVQHVYLQATPLSAMLPSSSGILEGGDLRLFSPVGKSEQEGATPLPMIDPGPPDALPKTFAFDDCRLYLSSWLERRKALVPEGLPAYTLSTLLRASRCSYSLYWRLQAGQMDHLLERHVQGLIKGLRLKDEQARDFPLLVACTFAQDPLARAKILRERLAIPGFRESRPAQAAVLAAFSSLVHLAVFELARHPDFRGDAAWIAERLTIGDRDRAEAALSDLIRIDALVPDHAGTPRPATAYFWVEAGQRSELFHALHLSMLEHARAMVVKQPERARSGAASFVLPVSALDAMAERFRAFHSRLEGRLQAALASRPVAPCELRLVTLQLIPGCEPLSFHLASESP